MKVSIIGTVGVPAAYGGFETLAEELTTSLSHRDFLVFCERSAYTKRPRKWKNCRLIYLPIPANGFSSIIYDALSLLISNVKGVRIHIVLGVSGCIFLPLFKRLFPGSKYIVNVDGIESRRAKWSKLAKAFLEFSEGIAVKNADVVVTDNKAIAEYVERKFDVKSETVAYGAKYFCDPKEKLNNDKIRAMALCRIEPENNVHLILEAFKRVNVPLTFIGNWNYSSYGRNLRQQYAKINNITLLDPIYDIEIIKKIRHDHAIYIHGHSVGGTNPSLVEAMAAGHLCICFDCVFNRFSTEDNALFFSSTQDLVAILNSIKIDTSISSKSYKIAVEKYTWKIISEQYEQFL